jgi:hypothetical protein
LKVIVMSKLWSYYFFIALFAAANVPAVATEEVGTSAVPFEVAPSPPRTRPPPVASPQPSRPPSIRSLGKRRPSWQLHNFPDGDKLLIAIMPGGNPACASYNGSQCLRGLTSINEVAFDRLRPLVCGEAHRAKWGVTGYEDRKHWCSLARSIPR